MLVYKLDKPKTDSSGSSAATIIIIRLSHDTTQGNHPMHHVLVDT